MWQSAPVFSLVQVSCCTVRLRHWYKIESGYMNADVADSKKQKMIASLVVLVLVTIMVLGIKAFTPKSPQANGAATIAPSAASTTATSNQAYKDGTYQAVGSYVSPAGSESLQVSVTLKNNVVAATTATSEANGPTAQEFQDEFIQGYQIFVVGKNVNDIRLSHVSGSSLTSQGFNDALTQIKDQAKTS